eukprot:Skav217254  [mRNA]  locus=scaffold47:663459:681947:+ [translate_table: standard]
MPRVHGDGIIHFSQFDAVLHHDGPLWIHKPKAQRRAQGINRWQMGIGSVPDAALSQLTNHRNLGIHTEMKDVAYTNNVEVIASQQSMIGAAACKTLPERARLLIDLAHPDDREDLERQAKERFKKAFR